MEAIVHEYTMASFHGRDIKDRPARTAHVKHTTAPFQAQGPMLRGEVGARALHVRLVPREEAEALLNSDSNQYNPIWHRSQCCGVKWERVRCACGQCRERRHGRARVCKAPG